MRKNKWKHGKPNTAKTDMLEHKIARQHHQLNTNTLFTIGRAGQKRLTECIWSGSYTEEIKGSKEINTVKYRVEAESTRTMNGNDQDLLFALLYLHRMRDKYTIENGDPDKLKISGAAKLGQYIKLKVSGYKLLKLLKWDTSSTGYKRLYASLDRLGRTYMVCKVSDNDYKRWWNTLMLRHDYELHRPTKKEEIEVIVSPLLALAAHSQKAALHSSHSLTERLSLKQPVKVLHGAICSRIRPGKHQRFNTTKLLGYMFGCSTISRKQKCLGTQHIMNLGDLDGWKVIYQKDSDSWHIHRPNLK